MAERRQCIQDLLDALKNSMACLSRSKQFWVDKQGYCLHTDGTVARRCDRALLGGLIEGLASQSLWDGKLPTPTSYKLTPGTLVSSLNTAFGIACDASSQVHRDKGVCQVPPLPDLEKLRKQCEDRMSQAMHERLEARAREYGLVMENTLKRAGEEIPAGPEKKVKVESYSWSLEM
jgi:hypothetical protein